MITDEKDDVRARALPLEIVMAEFTVSGTGKAETERSRQSLLRMGRVSQKYPRASHKMGTPITPSLPC